MNSTPQPTYDELIQQAEAHFNAREYGKAIECSTQALALDNTRPDAYYWRGRAYRRTYKEEEERKNADALLACTPVTARHFAFCGWAYYVKEEYQQAITECTEALRQEPSLKEAYLFRGLAYDDLKQYDLAIADFDKAIALDPKYAVAYFNRGIAYRTKGDYDRAIEDYTKATELHPKYANAYFNRGIAYSSKDDDDRAIKDYDKAIEFDPKDARFYNNRGNAYSSKGDYDRAIADYTKAIALDPEYALAYYNRGNTYYEQDILNRAIEDYNKSIEYFENSSPVKGHAFFNLALVYKELENFDESKEMLLKAEEAYREADGIDKTSLINDVRDALDMLKESQKRGWTGMSQALKEATSFQPQKEIEGRDDRLSRSRARVEKIIGDGEISAVSAKIAYRKKHKDSPANLGNWLICMRGWSSSTKDFLEIFCNFDLLPDKIPPHILQVHSVLVTHHHPDHFGDLSAINDLDSQIAIEQSDRELMVIVDPETHRQKSSLLDVRSATAKENGKTQVVLRQFSETGGKSSLDGEMNILNAFRVQHSEETPHAYGLNFELKHNGSDKVPVLLGFTGDTKYEENLSQNLEKCKIIVCNFSMTNRDDFARNEKKRKADHLGFHGLSDLINNTSAKMYVVTEFFGGLGEIRIPITQCLQDTLREDIKNGKSKRTLEELPIIIPADIGLVVDVESLKVMCSFCKEFIPAKDITVISSSSNFGRLLYLCPNDLVGQHHIVHTP